MAARQVAGLPTAGWTGCCRCSAPARRSSRSAPVPRHRGPLAGDFTSLASKFAQGLGAFLADLGPAIETTTVVVMTEFGRRVEANASGGVDHGHGGVALILGGGVNPGVKGAWDQQWYTSQDYLDTGDIPGTNDFRNLLSEVVMKRFGLTAAQISPVFPDWTPTAMGVMV